MHVCTTLCFFINPDTISRVKKSLRPTFLHSIYAKIIPKRKIYPARRNSRRIIRNLEGERLSNIDTEVELQSEEQTWPTLTTGE